jgi:protein-tyrosine phosphatase
MVLRNLWLGNMKDAQNKGWLKRHKIHTVFNCTPDLPETPGIPTVRFAINDSREDGDKMLKHGIEWAEEVMKAMEDGPVLIHCKEGRQRSATIALLLMGLKHPAQLHILLKKLQAKRPIALTPVPTFSKALKKWFYN